MSHALLRHGRATKHPFKDAYDVLNWVKTEKSAYTGSLKAIEESLDIATLAW